MTRTVRGVAGVLLVALAVLVAGGVAGAAKVIPVVVVLVGLPWSLAAVAVAVEDGPDAVVYAVGAAAALVNVVLVTYLARRVTR
jgi:multidrug transporter EmrE-like cation transporter